MLAFVAFGVLIHPWRPAVTRDYRAETLKTVLTSVSELTGRHLSATPDMEQQRMVISVRDASLSELKEKIASVTCGLWKSDKNGDRLVFDQKLFEARRDRQLRAYAEKIRAAQMRLLEPLAAEPVFGPTQAAGLLARLRQSDLTDKRDENDVAASQRAELASRNSPGARASARIANLFDPYEIAAIPGEAVYSDKPTRLQRPLKGLEPIYALLAKEQGAWTQVYSGDPDFEARRSYSMNDPRGHKDPIDPRYLRCVVRVSNSNPGQPHAAITIVDASGKQVLSGWANLETRVTPAGTKPATYEPTVKMPISKDLRDYVDAMGWGGKSNSVLAPEWKEILLRPDRHEPLAYGAAEPMIAASSALKENLVAAVPDDAIDAARLAFEAQGEPIDSAKFWRYAPYFQMATEAQGGWRLAWAAKPQPHLDRNVMTQFLGKLNSTGMIRLDDEAALASHSVGDGAPSIVYYTSQALVPGSASGLYMNQWKVVRFYGLLTDQQRRMLEDKETIALRDLPVAAQDALIDHLTSTSYGSFTFFDEQGRATRPSSALGGEPTEVLADAFSGDGMMALTRTRQPGAELFTTASASGPGEGYPLTIRELALHLLTTEMPDLKMYTRLHGADAPTCVPGYQSHVTLSLGFSRRLLCNLFLDDFEYDLRQTKVPVSTVADSFRAEIEAEQKQLRQTYSGRNQKTVPPPRL